MEANLYSIPVLADLIPRALWLDGDAYGKLKSNPQAQAAAQSGGRLVALLGLALGVAEFVRTLLNWAVTPDLTEVQRVLAQDLPALPMLGRWGAGVGELLAEHSWLWAALRPLWPTPALALARAVLTPLALLLGWLAYGCLAHGAARLLGGGGSLRDTLRCTALAEAPRIVLLWPFLPAWGLGLLGVGAWVLTGRWLALRAAHGLDPWRAFWAALGPLLLEGGLGLLALLALLGWAG